MHSLSNIDKENLTANCSICGGVEVIKRQKANRPNPYYSCKVKENERHSRAAKRYRAKNPNVSATSRAKSRGVVLDSYEKELHRWIVLQSGLCGICFTQMRKPNLDHCHTTGMVRGLLCTDCNQGIGFLGDSIARLKNAIRYLENSSGGT